MEIWKDIIGFEGVYKVSNLGNIKSLRKEYRAGNHNSLRIQEERILKPYSTGGIVTGKQIGRAHV